MKEKLIALAEKQIGVHESPIGSKNVKYNTAYYGGKVNNPALAWCVVFLWWLFRETGQSNLFYGGKKTASCATLYGYYKSKGQVKKTPKVGDIVFYDWNNNKSPDHVGLVVGVKSNGDIIAIEGNTSASNQSNGGYVQKKTRPKKYCMGFASPKYKEEPKYKTLGNMNFRTKPDLDGTVISVIPKGTILTGTVDSNGWLKTIYDGKSGYVRVKGQKVYCEKV